MNAERQTPNAEHRRPNTELGTSNVPAAAGPNAEVGTPNSTALRVVIVGHVDHGKSTLVGRLLHDTGSLPEGKFEQIQAVCRRRGMQFEWAFLLDALQAERDQNVTIDVS